MNVVNYKFHPVLYTFKPKPLFQKLISSVLKELAIDKKLFSVALSNFIQNVNVKSNSPSNMVLGNSIV